MVGDQADRRHRVVDRLVGVGRSTLAGLWGHTLMRRFAVLVTALSFSAVMALAPTAGADPGLIMSVDKAPIAPDGTTAGADTDFVVTFADRDPDVPGVGITAGGTISLTLDPAFVRDDPTVPIQMAVLQGWPQSPRLPFPTPSYDPATNTVTGTLSFDYEPLSSANPGPKQLHVVLLGFTNPAPGEYPLTLTIQPDPGDPATMSGDGTVQIIPRARPSINAISVINPGPPPPFPNSIYQTINQGEDPLRWGFYVWDSDNEPYVGVELRQKNRHHYSLVDERGRSIGQVNIAAPAGASGYWIEADASVPANGAVLGIPTGLLIAQFHPDPDVNGDYVISWRINNGNSQPMYLTVN